MKQSFFTILLIIFFSCSGKDHIPSDIMKPDKMQKILWDVARAQALSAEIARKDSAVNEIAETKVLNEKIFSLYNISEKDFNKTYNWYTSHPDILRSVLDSLGAQNQRDNEQSIKRKANPIKPGLKRVKQSL